MNIISWDEIMRGGAISTMVLIGWVVVFQLTSKLFTKTVGNNNEYIKDLMESLKALNGQ